ncbi:MAG: type II toxin-antitoxin system Phd/YefM family antitoxin [Gammaproteobacteria bacterium]|nr:type II toxin-antitoxin system Phd/YefM family antitoxin [Gammaproteobacteria bacterium]
MTQTIGAFEAKTHFSTLLEKVAKGEQIIITKHGHPVAKLVPTGRVDHEKTKQTIKRIKALSQKHTLGKINWKALRDEGRR